MAETMALTGKTALVTGASRGIGAAIAADLARNGMSLCLVARDRAAMERLAADLSGHGGRIVVHAADLTDPRAPAEAAARAAAELGGLDLLVNAAGDTKRGDFFALSDEDWASGFGLKFFGAVRLCRAAWPRLVERRGAVVNIVGMGARTPAAEFTIGGSVNSALMNFTKALAEIGLRDGVRVNAINPGWIATDRLNAKVSLVAAAEGLSPEDARQRLIEESGIARIGQAQDVANLVTFLASDRASYIHGATLDIDGGATRGI